MFWGAGEVAVFPGAGCTVGVRVGTVVALLFVGVLAGAALEAEAAAVECVMVGGTGE